MVMLPTLYDQIIYAEIKSQLQQREYFKPIGVRAELRDTYRRYAPVIFHVKDEPKATRVKYVYAEGDNNKIYYHLVFPDEKAPPKNLDEEYRKIRRQLLGRIHDVESIEIRRGTLVNFQTTYAWQQPYQTSLHFSAVARYTRKIFVLTWNHMLSTRPSIYAILRGVEKSEYELRFGSREDAERLR